MPELPDITAYLTALEPRVLGQTLGQLRIASPLLLRTAIPPLQSVEGRPVTSLRRLGKRIVFCFEPGGNPDTSPDTAPDTPPDLFHDRSPDSLFLVLHLMIAGRLHWREFDPTHPKQARPSLGGRNNLAAFDFPHGSLLLTEAGTKRRASLHLLRGDAALADLDPGGLDPFRLDLEGFKAALTLPLGAQPLGAQPLGAQPLGGQPLGGQPLGGQANRTLKRALTDPRLLSGIGNAYSDEILHAAQLSPLLQTRQLTPGQWQRLYTSTRETLQLWIVRLNAEARESFPGKVTAFRPELAVHGRFNQPCPRCGSPVQRIRFADNETNYCPTCQTGGTVLADRSLSRLLGADWPRTLDELEALKRR